MVGTINTSVTGQNATQPRGAVCVEAQGPLKSYKAGEVDLKVGMIGNYIAGGLDRVDAAADALNYPIHFEVPGMPTGARTDPMTNYVYEDNESVDYYDMKPHYKGYFRCKDASLNIDYGNTLELDTTNEGMVKRMAVNLSIASGTTAVLSTAANGASLVTGEDVPKFKLKALNITQRAAGATETWLLCEVIGW